MSQPRSETTPEACPPRPAAATSVPAEPSVIEASRLLALVQRFAAISEPGPGVTRLPYTLLERQAHEVFAAEMRALGLAVSTDAAGNTVAELPASAGAEGTGRAAVGTGSHLDSVPQGGRFDGIAGVCAAMEVARVATASGEKHRRPWRFVVFAAEEGARFGQACNGSRMAAGLTSASDLPDLRDAAGISMAKAMAEVGLRPGHVDAERWRSEDWHAFVELHVEQGAVLEEAGLAVGAVNVISGSTRFRVTVEGRSSHSGGTPMELRHDALAAAAECVLAGEELATDARHSDARNSGTRVTVGILEVAPGSITTIPGTATFAVDVRDLQAGRQRESAAELRSRFADIAARRGVSVRIEELGETPPVRLANSVVEEIRAAAAQEGLPHRVMPSGASHDTQQIARLMPAAMIFAPSRAGLSHVPQEWTEPEDLAAATRVLWQTMRRLDAA